MDQKTVEALALMQTLSEQIKEISRKSAALSAALLDPALLFVPGNFAYGMCLGQTENFFYPVLTLNEAERAEIVAVLERYTFRLDSILSGCSIKLSQAMKEMIAEQDKLRDDMLSQAARIKGSDLGGKQ